MKKVVKFAVEYPITILMLVFAVLLLGIISFNKLGMDLFPDMNNPRIFVELKTGEQPPEEIERQFVKNIEASAFRLKNVIRISSTSQVGAALIAVEYAWNTNMDEAFLDIQKTLSDFKQIPEVEDLIISQYDPNATPILLLGFSHPDITDMDELRKTAESYIRNELIRLEGIADVKLLGDEKKEVIIETNPYVMEAFGLTPSEITGKINEYNRNISSGSITEMGTKYIIKGISEFKSLDDIKKVIVAYTEPSVPAEEVQSSLVQDKVPVFLNDIAEIKYQNKIPDNIVHINQNRCMALAVYKETKYNTVRAVREFMGSIKEIEKNLPGYNITIIDNQGDFIITAIDEVQQTLLYGIILAVIILFVFLRRIGATAIISTAIPISIVATFNLMYFNGLTLNIMTLGGLALGAGMLVDNAIVVMENIFRNLEEGKSLKDASITGTSQVGGAITASTLTTIVVFLPIVYLHGSAGELFKDQAWTVAFSLLSSLLVAILVIPMLSSRILKKREIKKEDLKSIKFPRYANFLEAVLPKKWLVILIAAVLVTGSILILPFIGSEFIPKTDTNEYTIDINLPQGTELYRTSNTVSGIENNIIEVFGDNIETLYSISGYTDVGGITGTVFQDENTATVKLILKKDSNADIDYVFGQLNTILSIIPDLESSIYQEQTALELTVGTDTAPLTIEVMGEDLDVLQGLTDQIKEKLSAYTELYNIETSFDEGRPEIDIVLDPIRAGIENINIDNLNSQLENMLLGAESGEWDNEGELMDITIKLPRMSVSDVENIFITSGTKKVILSSIADIKESRAPMSIIRKNQVRTGRVTANIKGGYPLDRVVRKLDNTIGEIELPPDYKTEISGEEQQRREAFDNLKFALILSLILVYMVLASQFESLIHPFVIILSIPLAIVGAILIFLIVGKALNIMAYIGIIMLVGIAVNDSIIFVDAINQLKKEGLPRDRAIIMAGQRRIRPIIMTSLTTILALFPLTIGFGEGASLRSPMALAVIGGLVTATFLTLVVIPCVYSVMDRFGEMISFRKVNTD
ncbi:efflux RND transporter permease subunit [candidate division KSB1 bacterium]